MSASTAPVLGMASILLVGCTAGVVATKSSDVDSSVTTPHADVAATTTPDGRSTRARSTVVTQAGRIEATATNGRLMIDLETENGWDVDVERGDHAARVEWTRDHRSVVVDLRVGPTGIDQEVTSTS